MKEAITSKQEGNPTNWVCRMRLCEGSFLSSVFDAIVVTRCKINFNEYICLFPTVFLGWVSSAGS